MRFKTAPSADLRRILGQQPFLALGAQWHCNVSATIQGGSATPLLYAKATRTRFQQLSAELTVQPVGLFDVIQGWASVEVQPPADGASRQRKPKARKPDSLDATIPNATGLRSKAHTLAVTTGRAPYPPLSASSLARRVVVKARPLNTYHRLHLRSLAAT